jgi:hypothetical protein
LHRGRLPRSRFARVLIRCANDHGSTPALSPVSGFVPAKLPHSIAICSVLQLQTSLLISCSRKQDLASFPWLRHEWLFEDNPKRSHSSRADARNRQRSPIRKAGTAPCRAIRWSVFGWIWSSAAASSVFRTRSKAAAGNSGVRDSGVRCMGAHDVDSSTATERFW